VGYSIFNTLGVGLWGIDSNQNLPYFFSSEWLTINEFKEIESDGNKRLQLSFELTMPDFPDGIKNSPGFAQKSSKWKHYSLKGNVVLTTDYFLVSEATFHQQFLFYTKDVTLKIDYDLETYRASLPKNFYRKEINCEYIEEKEDRNIYEAIQQFDLRETNPKDYKRFTLSHYGLPEPDFGEQRPNRVRYTLMVIGILMIVIALWQMYQKRKEQKG
jgi:hypothetical protein